MTQLHEIHDEVQTRVDETTSTHRDWPCCKGCDECCRRLASVPRVTWEEWDLIAAALDALPASTGEKLRRRIEESASLSRPVTCPLLDATSGTCLVYEARPVACRAYGFYAERQYVLGCERIELLAEHSPDLIWGNHIALEDRLDSIGPAAELFHWVR